MDGLRLPVFRSLFHLNDLGTTIDERFEQCLHSIVDLSLACEECRIVRREGIGPKQYGKVGEVVDIGSQVGLSAPTFIPLLGQGGAMGAYNVHRSQELCDLEARRKNYDVEFISLTARADDAGLGDLPDSMIQEFNIW